jgi:transposase
MTGKRRRYGADFKAKVALEALRGELTAAQLATKYSIHPTMVGDWKRQAMEGLTAIFAERSDAREKAKSSEAEVEKNSTPRSASCWWNGIFWRKPPVDERGQEEGVDRSGSPAAINRSPVRAGFDRALDILS